MENNQFDRNIKKKLKDLEAEFNPNDWNAFEDRLNMEENPGTEPEIDDIYFDGVVYDKLNKYEEAYNPAHWTLMNSQLDDAFSFRKKIYKYKVLELALMFFAIFTFLQFFPIDTVPNPTIQKTDQEEAPLKKEDQLPVANLLSPNTAHANEERVQTEKKETKNKATQKNNTKSKQQQLYQSNAQELAIGLNPIEVAEEVQQTSPVVDSIDPTQLDKSMSSFSIFTPISPLAIVDVEQTKFTPTTLADVQKSLSTANTPFKEFNATEIKQAKIDLSKNALAGLIAPIHTKELRPFAFNHEKRHEKDLPYQLPELKHTGLRFSMFSTLDYNYVLTPYDVLFESEAQTRTAIGYGAGFALSFRFKQFELETGAAYSVKKYDPGFVEQIGRTSQDLSTPELEILTIKLRDIELNVLNIPLNLRYTFGKFGKWQTSVLAGASLNMALQASYDRQRIFDGSPIGENLERYRRFEAALEKPIVLDSKKYPDGLLEGGNFMENSYFTANIGLGIERILSPRWSLFFQPSYHHFIQVSEERLGPNKDRINTLSISAGAKVTLK